MESKLRYQDRKRNLYEVEELIKKVKMSDGGKGGDGGMWKLKSCPRCNGDIFLEKDISGWYQRCLQCGFNKDLKVMVEVKEGVPRKKKEPVLQR
jgi:hypothetical protein